VAREFQGRAARSADVAPVPNDHAEAARDDLPEQRGGDRERLGKLIAERLPDRPLTPSPLSDVYVSERDAVTEAYLALEACSLFGISPFGRSTWDEHTAHEQAHLLAFVTIRSQREARST
jgi:hypothetical protein